MSSVIDTYNGAADEDVKRLAKEQNRAIVTMDKGFGYLALLHKPPCIVILRLNNPWVEKRFRVLLKVLEFFGDRIYDSIIMFSEMKMRRRPIA